MTTFTSSNFSNAHAPTVPLSAPRGRVTIGGVTPAPSPTSIAERDRLAEYERWLSSPSLRAIATRWLLGEPGAFLLNTPVLRLPSELRLDGSERVLDIGCGRGALLRQLDRQLRFARDPVGLDSSRALLRLAGRDEARAGRPSALLRASATALPFAAASFTLVLCGHLLRHLDDAAVRDLLDEIWRVLAPGGLAVLWEFAPTGRRLLDGWNRRWLSPGVAAPRLRTTAQLLALAGAAGFPFGADAELRPFLAPPIPRASVLIGRPPDDFEPAAAAHP